MAVNLETLLMPGKLISGHKKYEEQCDKCHESFNKQSQRRLCLACHKPVAADVRNKRGLHGLDNDISDVECKRCHSDHLGRDADIVQFNKVVFDHNNTDFELKYRHSGLACEACHRPKKLFREASSACYSCHKDQDAHNEKLGKKCADCHTSKGWAEHIFDHNKTSYELSGKHRKVSCSLCHPHDRYKSVPKKCDECHLINDIHNDKYGMKCERCHTTKGWNGYDFDHDRKTKFVLEGAHKEASCSGCHEEGDFKKNLKKECYACHKKQDIHEGALGKRCEGCHGEKRWRKHRFDHDNYKKTACVDCHESDDIHMGRYGSRCSSCHLVSEWSKGKFNHDQDTKFELKGQHKDVACMLCHKGSVKDEKEKKECNQCHLKDDVHNKNLGNDCRTCHNEQGWHEYVNFDHDISRFPLVGLHAVAPCEACHLDSEYRDTSKICYACHKDDDDHNLRLGKNCGFCHNPNSWAYWQFDHDKESDFELKGSHKDIVCKACHRSPVNKKVKLNTTCYSCHRSEDIHDGGFGRDCGRCHNQKDFAEIEMNR